MPSRHSVISILTIGTSGCFLAGCEAHSELSLLLCTLVVLLLTLLISRRHTTRKDENVEMSTDVVANLAHDLKNPISAIQGVLDLLKQEEHKPIDSTTRIKLIDVATRNTKALSSIVNDFLELSKLESDSPTTNSEFFSMRDLASDLKIRFSTQALDKKIDLEFECPDDLPNVKGDCKMLERAIANLLSNAIYYTQSEGKVRALFSSNQDLLKFQVIDNGIGIPKEELDMICQRFYRVSKARSKTTGGTGLGLAITKKILEAHGSELIIESELGRGTNVWFEIPINR